MSEVPSTTTLSVSCSPGRTIPTVGETVAHVAPEVAVNEIGAPFVVSVTVCAADGSGGAVKLNVDGLSVSVDGGEVTSRVTATITGASTPVTVIVIEEEYVPTASPVGFTLTLILAGKFPLVRLVASQ